MRCPALALSVVLLALCTPLLASGAPLSELALTGIRAPDEVFAEQGFMVEVFFTSSLSPEKLEKLIKTFEWQIEGTDRKTGSKSKPADESRFTVTENSILIRTSVGKPNAASLLKLKIEYGESEPFKTTNTVSSNPFTVSRKPDLSTFIGQWVGYWEWTPDKHGKRSRDAKLTVEADKKNELLVTLTLGIAYTGTAKALLPREAIAEKTWTRHASIKRKNGVIHLSIYMRHQELELHLDNDQLVGGLTTAPGRYEVRPEKSQELNRINHSIA